jgi:hypothetical protein
MRLKLGGPKPKVTLNLTQHRGSPAPGVTVDNEALQRQKQAVAAGVNGQGRPPTVNGAVRTIEPRPQSSTGHAGSPSATAVKTEKLATQSPAPNDIAPPLQRSASNGMMPPPAMRPPSGTSSPFGPPQALSGAPHSSYHFTAPSLLPAIPTRQYPLEAALLPLVTIATHPHLSGIPKPFRLEIPPHSTLSHQSSTITLPPTHYFLQISPTISKQLSMGRPYKMFVTVNGTRLTQRDTQFHADTGRRSHVYEGSLAQGVNRIEVEVVASKLEEAKGLDVEKVTVYANLMKP